MEFRILGPLEVYDDGRLVRLAGQRQRALLAILLLHANEVVSHDRLIDELWGERAPSSGAKALQINISRLRRAIEASAILTRPGGYVLQLGSARLDLERFYDLVQGGRRALAERNWTEAAGTLHQALHLWRGRPLADFAYEPWAQKEIARLEEDRLAALEDRVDADLALGRHVELAGELEALVADHPLRERLRGQLMTALYRSGRQVDALAEYRAAREKLVGELGIEPGPALQRLERAILQHDPAIERDTSAGDTSAPATGVQPISFVGRSKELREVRKLLHQADVRLLTLSGAGGTGKTRLALEVTRDCGPILVELASVSDHELVAPTIAGALGLQTGATAAILAYLRARRPLVLLDNFEQVIDAAPLLTELLDGAPEARLIVTSRAPLGLAHERIYPVPALELPDAVRLFVGRAHEADAHFELSEVNAEAVAELCLRLDGLPLALELAAARISLLSPRAILARLGRRLDLLKSDAVGTAVRHRTLRAAIGWSYDLLRPEEQGLFASLAVFVGGFTVDGAEAVAGELGLDVLDGVSSLLRNSLLRPERRAGDEPRFGMLETIREYALERMAESAEANTIRQRHADFYVAFAEQAEPELRGPHQAIWLERLDAEHDNLRAVMSWSREGGDLEPGLRIATALWRFWQVRGHLTEGRERLERLLAVRGGSKRVRADAQAAAARTAFMQGDYEAVRRFGELSLPIHRRLAADRTAALTLGVLAGAAQAQGDPDRAHACYEESLETARRASDTWNESVVLGLIGGARAARGEFTEARRALEESLRAAREFGDVRLVGLWLASLGGVALAERDIQRARRRFDESLTIRRELGDSWGVAQSLWGAALASQAIGDHDAARGMLTECIEIRMETDDRPGLAAALEAFASLAAAQRHGVRAARLYGSASVVRDAVRVHSMEFGRPDVTGEVDALRAVVDADLFADAWAQGRAMTLAESLAYALEEPTATLAPASTPGPSSKPN